MKIEKSESDFYIFYLTVLSCVCLQFCFCCFSLYTLKSNKLCTAWNLFKLFQETIINNSCRKRSNGNCNKVNEKSHAWYAVDMCYVYIETKKMAIIMYNIYPHHVSESRKSYLKIAQNAQFRYKYQIQLCIMQHVSHHVFEYPLSNGQFVFIFFQKSQVQKNSEINV